MNIAKLMENNLFNNIFQDQEGKIVLAQMPNLPLITWIVASLFKDHFYNWQDQYRTRSSCIWCFVYLGLGRVISRR